MAVVKRTPTRLEEVAVRLARLAASSEEVTAGSARAVVSTVEAATDEVRTKTAPTDIADAVSVDIDVTRLTEMAVVEPLPTLSVALLLALDVSGFDEGVTVTFFDTRSFWSFRVEKITLHGILSSGGSIRTSALPSNTESSIKHIW